MCKTMWCYLQSSLYQLNQKHNCVVRLIKSANRFLFPHSDANSLKVYGVLYTKECCWFYLEHNTIQLEPLLLIESMDKALHLHKLWDVITHPYPYFNDGWAKSLNLGYGWLIAIYADENTYLCPNYNYPLLEKTGLWRNLHGYHIEVKMCYWKGD